MSKEETYRIYNKTHYIFEGYGQQSVRDFFENRNSYDDMEIWVMKTATIGYEFTIGYNKFNRKRIFKTEWTNQAGKTKLYSFFGFIFKFTKLTDLVRDFKTYKCDFYNTTCDE